MRGIEEVVYQQRRRTTISRALTQRDAFAVSDQLAALVKATPGQGQLGGGDDTAFAPLISNGTLADGLPRQLYQIAKLIAGNATVQGNRQIFFAQLGGFDTRQPDRRQRARGQTPRF